MFRAEYLILLLLIPAIPAFADYHYEYPEEETVADDLAESEGINTPSIAEDLEESIPTTDVFAYVKSLEKVSKGAPFVYEIHFGNESPSIPAEDVRLEMSIDGPIKVTKFNPLLVSNDGFFYKSHLTEQIREKSKNISCWGEYKCKFGVIPPKFSEIIYITSIADEMNLATVKITTSSPESNLKNNNHSSENPKLSSQVFSRDPEGPMFPPVSDMEVMLFGTRENNSCQSSNRCVILALNNGPNDAEFVELQINYKSLEQESVADDLSESMGIVRPPPITISQYNGIFSCSESILGFSCQASIMPSGTPEGIFLESSINYLIEKISIRSASFEPNFSNNLIENEIAMVDDNSVFTDDNDVRVSSNSEVPESADVLIEGYFDFDAAVGAAMYYDDEFCKNYVDFYNDDSGSASGAVIFEDCADFREEYDMGNADISNSIIHNYISEDLNYFKIKNKGPSDAINVKLNLVWNSDEFNSDFRSICKSNSVVEQCDFENMKSGEEKGIVIYKKSKNKILVANANANTFDPNLQNNIEKDHIILTVKKFLGERVPDWFKKNAVWWGEGKIDDESFVNGIQHLIEKEIIVIDPKMVENTPGIEHEAGVEKGGTFETNDDYGRPTDPSIRDANQGTYHTDMNIGIPSWIKTTAQWWGEGQISEDEFLRGIGFLIENKILKIK